MVNNLITKVGFKANQNRRGPRPAGGRQTRGRPEHGAGGAPRSAGDRRQARVPSGRTSVFQRREPMEPGKTRGKCGFFMVF